MERRKYMRSLEVPYSQNFTFILSNVDFYIGFVHEFISETENGA